MIRADFWECGGACWKWPVPGAHQLWKGKTERWHSSRLPAKERGEPVTFWTNKARRFNSQKRLDLDLQTLLRQTG